MIEFPEDAEITGKYGPPIIPKGKTGLAINPRYFAARVIGQQGLVFFNDGGWYEWSADRWMPRRECELWSRISDVLDQEVRAYSTSPKPTFTLKLPKPTVPAFDLVNTSNINEIMRTMKYMCNRGDKLPPLDPDVIPVKNGLLRWNADTQDFDFRAYTSDDMIFHTLDVVYDPEAKSALFDKVLSEIVSEPEDRRVIQHYLGSALSSENRTKKFMTFTGVSNSGKSMLLEVFTKIMTPKRIFDLDPKTLSGNYGLSPLTTQTLITVFEAGKDAFCNPFLIELFKKASGGDPFKSNRKNSNEQVEHVGLYSILFTSNYNQRFMYEGDGGEFANRLLPILFTKPIENPDLTLGDTLKRDHRPAIFNWLLDGARYVRRNNWNISLSPEQKVRRDRLIQATRGIDLFVKNYIVAAPSHHITTEEAYKAYDYLYRVAGFEFLDITTFQKRFSDAMTKKFGYIHAKNLPGPNGKCNARGYQNVAFANNPSTSNTNNERKTL